MANNYVATPRTNFRWVLELDGLNVFEMQEVDTPEPEISEIVYGAPGNMPDIKIPGKPKVSDLVVRKIRPIERSDTWAWDWMANVVLFPVANMRIGFLREFAPDMSTVLNSYYLAGVWPKKIGSVSYISEGDGDKIMEEVTFACQFFFNQESVPFKQLFRL